MNKGGDEGVNNLDSSRPSALSSYSVSTIPGVNLSTPSFESANYKEGMIYTKQLATLINPLRYAYRL